MEPEPKSSTVVAAQLCDDDQIQKPRFVLKGIRCIPLWLSASVIAACNAMVFGLDTGTIGPVTSMPSFVSSFGQFSTIVHGAIVSSILLPGALAALVAGILADKYGRTRMIAIGSGLFGLGGVLEAAAPRLAMFIVGRLMKGTGEGIFLSTVFVYVCEISPTKTRGIVTSFPQICTTIGIVIGFFTCYGTSNLAGSLSWRLPIAIQASISILNAVASFLLPPSPRWLRAKGRSEEATTVMARLGIDEVEQAELGSQSAAVLAISVDEFFYTALKHTMTEFKEAFSSPYRSRTIFGCFLMIIQQLSGIDGVLYYAPELFRQAGLSSQQSTFLASGVSAVVIVTTAIPAMLLADSWGRKASTLVGGFLIFALMFTMGTLYAVGAVHADSGAGRWVVIVGIYLFAAVFSATWAIHVRAYLIESQPQRTRGSASSLGQSSNWLANYFVALVTPVFLSASIFGMYYFFAFTTLVGTLICAVFMHETRGHSLESIEERHLKRQAAGRPWLWSLKQNFQGRREEEAVSAVDV